MITRVVHVNDKVEGAVYIGRAMKRGKHQFDRSRFANPFRVEIGGRAWAIEMYRNWVLGGVPGVELLARLPELRGKPLACWCRHDGEPKTDQNACHGDVLVELLDRYTDDELRAMTGGTS